MGALGASSTLATTSYKSVPLNKFEMAMFRVGAVANAYHNNA